MTKTHPAKFFGTAALLGLVLAATPAPGPALAQDIPPTSATAPAPMPEAVEITITGVEGLVQVRTAEDKPWQRAQVGMKLDQGAEFRTGPRSAVRFVMPPDQTVTLDRLGTVKVLQAIRDVKKVKTDLGMKYGRTRYDIEAAGLEHESTIRGPGATLAVRGTRVNLYDQPPFAPEARSLTGRALYTNAKKQKSFFGAKGKKARIGGEQDNAAETARLDTYLDTTPMLARTQDERDILLLQSLDPIVVRNTSDVTSVIANAIATGARDTIDVVTNRTRAVPGNLAFDLRWSGVADLDLYVVSPLGERLASFPLIVSGGQLVYLFSSRTVPSGGRIDFEDQGAFEPTAPTTTAARETAYWPTTYPTGRYTIKANLSQGDAGQLTLGVYQLGQLQQNFSGSVSASSPQVSYTVTISAPTTLQTARPATRR